MFNSNKSAKKQLLSSMVLTSLLCAEALLANSSARATTPHEIPTRLSQLQPWRQTYACGDFAVTLSEQGDRYTYEAVNAKGEKLTLSNGTQHDGRNYSSIYTFSKDGSEYVLEDFGGGKAALSISSYPNSNATYDCTTDGT